MTDDLFWQLREAPIGARLYFSREKRPYRVRARSGRFLVCTKPFAAQKTVLYTVIDLVERVRGPENLVFGMGAETDEQCWDMLDRLDGRDANHPNGKDVQNFAQWEREKKTLPKDLRRLSKPSRSFRTEVSHRNRVDLDLIRVRIPKECKPF